MDNYIKGEVEIIITPNGAHCAEEEYALKLLSRQLADKIIKKKNIVAIDNSNYRRIIYTARCYVFTREELLEQLRRAEEKGKAAVWDQIKQEQQLNKERMTNETAQTTSPSKI